MRKIWNKDGTLLAQFVNINENDTRNLERLADLPSQIRYTPQEKTLIIKHPDTNKGKLKGHFYLEEIFGSSKTYKKVTEVPGFHLMLKTNDWQSFI